MRDSERLQDEANAAREQADIDRLNRSQYVQAAALYEIAAQLAIKNERNYARKL